MSKVIVSRQQESNYIFWKEYSFEMAFVAVAGYVTWKLGRYMIRGSDDKVANAWNALNNKVFWLNLNKTPGTIQDKPVHITQYHARSASNKKSFEEILNDSKVHLAVFDLRETPNNPQKNVVPISLRKPKQYYSVDQKDDSSTCYKLTLNKIENKDPVYQYTIKTPRKEKLGMVRFCYYPPEIKKGIPFKNLHEITDLFHQQIMGDKKLVLISDAENAESSDLNALLLTVYMLRGLERELNHENLLDKLVEKTDALISQKIPLISLNSFRYLYNYGKDLIDSREKREAS
jgi:hypothetical protein